MIAGAVLSDYDRGGSILKGDQLSIKPAYFGFTQYKLENACSEQTHGFAPAF